LPASVNGYGDIGVGEYSIGDNMVSIVSVSGKKFLYKRVSGGVVVCEKIIAGFTELRLVPLYPLLYPKYITDYILVELEKTIDIAPGIEIDFYIEVPVDIALYAYHGREFRVIDSIPLSKPKYTLYGKPSEGVIARYTRSPIHANKPSPAMGKALGCVKARNKTREWVTLSKILLSADNLRLHYREGSWMACIQDIEVNIDSPQTATVTYSKPSWEDVKPIDEPPIFRQPRIQTRLILRTDMLWGI